MSEPVFVELSVDPPVERPAPNLPAPAPTITFDGPVEYPPDVHERLAAEAAAIIARYPQSRSALLPLLHLVQSEDGFITRAGILFCAAQLDLTAAQVASVATFYSMYRRNPTGEYLIGVCTNTCAPPSAETTSSDRCVSISASTPATPPPTAASPSNTSNATPPATSPPS